MVAMTGEKKTKTEKSKAPSKTASKAVTGKTPSKTAGNTTNKAPGKNVGKAPGKTASKTAVKPAGRVPVKPVSRTLGRSAGKPMGRTVSKTIPSKERYPRYSAPKIDWNAFIEKMEKLLQEEKSEIINTLIANNNDFKEIVDGMDPKDFADIASDDIDRKMIEMLGSQELKRLKLIESAQTRIKQGKYGHCIKCDRPIPPERLEAIPYALMCIDCKSEEERRNR
jgi:RNA polymerase-binding transcription factor DksA